jgi:hypothetical protein
MTPDLPEDDANLFFNLHKWAIRQDENFTTEAFAHLLRYLRDFEPEAAVQILTKLVGNDSRISIGRLKELYIETQIPTEKGTPDIRLRTLDSLVYVEAKVESGLGSRQMTCYREELKQSGVPNTALILLTRYPPELPPGESPPDAYVRWYQVAHWLIFEMERQAIRGPIGIYLTQQFVGFLKARNITMERVGWELPGGIRACRNLMTMLGEVIASRNLRYTRATAWDYIAYYPVFLDRQLFVYLHYDRPGAICFDTNQMPVDSEKAKTAEQAGCGRVVDDGHTPGGIKWERFLQLNDISRFWELRFAVWHCLPAAGTRFAGGKQALVGSG